MLLGERIERRRKRLGLTQQQLAERTGIQQTLISRLERGANSNPHADVLKRLAIALQCSTDWLLGMYDDSPDASELVEALSSA